MTTRSANIGHLLTGLGILVLLGISISGFVYKAYSRNEDKQDVEIREVKESYINTQLDVNTIQGDVRYIKEDIRQSKVIQQKILDKLE